MYNIMITEKFEKDMEYYRKKKKYKHIDFDVETVVAKLLTGNLIGDRIPRLKFKR